MIIPNHRIGNIELLRTESIHTPGEFYYEIVQWTPNEMYDRKSEYVYDENKGMYKHSECGCIYYSPSCFENKETHMTLGVFNTDVDDDPVFRTIGCRPFLLDDKDFMDFREIANYFYKEYFEQLDKYED